MTRVMVYMHNVSWYMPLMGRILVDSESGCAAQGKEPHIVFHRVTHRWPTPSFARYTLVRTKLSLQNFHLIAHESGGIRKPTEVSERSCPCRESVIWTCDVIALREPPLDSVSHNGRVERHIYLYDASIKSGCHST